MIITSKEIIEAFFLAFAVTFLLTPVAIWIAPKIGAMDIPKDNRRMHNHAIPRFGGFAIYIGSMVSLYVFLGWTIYFRAIFIGGSLIYLLGLIDDLRGLRAMTKFGIELVVATLMYAMGLRITFIANYFGTGNVTFGMTLCYIVTVLWIVGITNTINIIDGLDGLAAGLCAIACICIAYVAYIHGYRYGMMIVSVGIIAVAGSAMGFLPFNFYPARIFMGDGGSLYLGFMLSIMSVIGPLKRSTIIALIVPMLILGIPIFDTSFAIFRRIINRQPIMSADRGHLHHRLMALGYGQRRAVLMLYGIGGIMGMAAVLLSRELMKDSMVLIAIAMVYIYVFLTDANHVVPKIRQQKGKAEETKKDLGTGAGEEAGDPGPPGGAPSE